MVSLDTWKRKFCAGNVLTQIVHKTEVPLDWRDEIVRWPELLRFRAAFGELSDLFLSLLMLISFAGMFLSIVLIVTGRLGPGHGFNFTPQEIIGRQSFPPTFGQSFPPTFTQYQAQVAASFIPALIINLFSICWISGDRFYRTTQPIAGMFEPGNATETILLDYVGTFPPLAIIKAINKKHWRVAWFAFLAVTCTFAPLPVGSTFIYTPATSGTQITLVPAGLYASMAILSIYSLSLIFVRPPERYRLPHAIRNLADLLSYCYDSKVIDDPEFSVQESTDEHVHLDSKVHLRKGRYQFGMYRGKDGRRHIGFDRADRREQSGDVDAISRFEPGRAVHITTNLQWWLRRPRLLVCADE
jgi:hypothetical protein